MAGLCHIPDGVRLLFSPVAAYEHLTTRFVVVGLQHCRHSLLLAYSMLRHTALASASLFTLAYQMSYADYLYQSSPSVNVIPVAMLYHHAKVRGDRSNRCRDMAFDFAHLAPKMVVK